MKRKNNVSDKKQKKISRSGDRSAGRPAIDAANQKSAKARQNGDPHQHQIDMVNLNMSNK